MLSKEGKTLKSQTSDSFFLLLEKSFPVVSMVHEIIYWMHAYFGNTGISTVCILITICIWELVSLSLVKYNLIVMVNVVNIWLLNVFCNSLGFYKPRFVDSRFCYAVYLFVFKLSQLWMFNVSIFWKFTWGLIFIK